MTTGDPSAAAAPFRRPSTYLAYESLRCGTAGDPDRYQLIDLVGVGGIEGPVFSAFDSRSHDQLNTIAVKVANPDWPELEQERLRVRWATAAAAATDHPGLVRLGAPFVGPAPHPPGQADQRTQLLYLPMGFVMGRTLDDLLRSPDADPNALLAALVQPAAALDYLRSRRLVHLDVKPANVIVDIDAAGHPTGHATLVDIGSLRGADSHPSLLTPGFAAPEAVAAQAGEENELGAADTYAFAATVICVITGVDPVRGGGQARWAALLERCLPGREQLRALLLAGVAESPGHRPTNLTWWLDQVRAATGPTRSAVTHPGLVGKAPRSPLVSAGPAVRSRRGLRAAAAVSAVVLTAGAAAAVTVYLGRGNPGTTAAGLSSSPVAGVPSSGTPGPSGSTGPSSASRPSQTSAAKQPGASTVVTAPARVGGSGATQPAGARSTPKVTSPARKAATTPAPVTTPPPPPPTTWTERSGSHGSPTFLNPANASGPGGTVPAMSYVTVLCRVYDPQIASANPDGWWYRLGGAFGGTYYAVANTFWNGDVPNQLPYTHNTDFAVAVC